MLGAAALAFAAEDPNAPLANTKAQLQALKKDTAAQTADAPDSPKLNLPSLASPTSELELPRPPRDDAKEKKGAGQKDWLLDGFDKLNRKRPPSAAKRGDGKSRAEDQPLDPNDPDYFLRLYEKQRAERDAAQMDVRGPSTNEKPDATADPFAPFMRQWLANSPVRDVLQDGTTEPTGIDPGLSSVTTNYQASAASPNALTSEPVRSNGRPNPFVQASGLPALESGQPTAVRPPAANGTGNLTPPAPPAPADSIYNLPERPKADLKRALPPPPSEDKKYFPQLKKF